MGVVRILTLAVVLQYLTLKVEALNCTFNHTDYGFYCHDKKVEADFHPGFGLAFVVAVCVSLFLGMVLGVACSVAVYKLMKWMEGKTLVFSPWPKIQSAMDIEESALQNPTYELGNSVAAKPSSNRYIKNSQQASSNQKHEVYEAIEEPINQAEVLDPTEQFSPLPYAIHDFSEDSTTVKGPAVPSKVNINRPKKGKGKNADIRRSMSESGRLETTTEVKFSKLSKPIALKPPIAQKKTALSSRTQSESASAAPPSQGAYSELDQKMSYATLEPHIGGEDVTIQPNSQESYSHLNH